MDSLAGMSPNLALILITGALVGASSGFLGSFMILKRMALVGDALSHVALPGMGIALVLAINPMLGALVALALAIFGIWYLGEKTEIYPEALVGVFFTASLAIGVLVTPDHELLEALFGDLESILFFDSIATILAAILIFVVTLKLSNKLLLGIVSEDLAKSSGIGVSKINLVYLLLVGLVVALGIKFVGTLLTGALVIVPAASAKNIAASINQFQVYSALIGLFSTVVGILVAQALSISSGPAVVLVAIGCFTLSYIFKK
jgi:ABC-type Mn2+/Zn2+ transport system permease subunit